jgi:hypothetical protein
MYGPETSAFIRMGWVKSPRAGVHETPASDCDVAAAGGSSAEKTSSAKTAIVFLVQLYALTG